MKHWNHCPPGCTFYYDHPCDLYVYPAPSCDADNAIEVEVILVPSRDTCFADRRLYEEYAEDIAHGALSKLLLIPNTEWYDPRSAGMYELKFNRAISRAKVDVARGGQSGPQYAQPSRCFMP